MFGSLHISMHLIVFSTKTCIWSCWGEIMLWTYNPPKTMVKAIRFQCEHSRAQSPLWEHQSFCNSVVFRSKFCLEISLLSPSLQGSAKWKKQLQKLLRRTQDFSSLSVGDSTPDLEAPITRLPFQWWEAADVFVFNYFPCCIHSVFLLTLTRLFLLPALSCLFVISAVWCVVVIYVHPACCASIFTNGASCMQRLFAVKR